MGYFLAALVLVDGLVSRNPSAWASLPRALLALYIVGVAVLDLYRAGQHLDVLAAVIVGIVAAMVVSESYRALISGLSLWVIYLGAFVLARSVRSDWAGDVTLAGVIVSVFALVMYFIPPPEGAWNRNVIGAVLVVCLAASFVSSNLTRSLIILSGILLTGSRGAMTGAFVAWAVMYYARALVAAPALAGGLIMIRPVTAEERIVCWAQGMRAWLDHFAFGVGPGLIENPVFWNGQWWMRHAHNAYIALGAQVGLVGLAVLAAFVAVSRRANISRAAIAALAGVATHSIVDDPLIALPVGLMLVLLVSQPGCDTPGESQ